MKAKGMGTHFLGFFGLGMFVWSIGPAIHITGWRNVMLAGSLALMWTGIFGVAGSD